MHRFDYLVQGKRLIDAPAALRRNLAHIDGAVLLDSRSTILAYGAIVAPSWATTAPERLGGRATAAISASRFGKALKISEDGSISFFHQAHCVWEI